MDTVIIFKQLPHFSSQHFTLIFQAAVGQPDPHDRVVVDGTWIWTYYPSADSTQVIRTSAGQGTGGV